jgi:hypothetical protein
MSQLATEDPPILLVALIDASSDEQAFQFVVINNKAAKVPTDNVKAIIATVSENDLRDRLLNAGVNYGDISATLKDITRRWRWWRRGARRGARACASAKRAGPVGRPRRWDAWWPCGWDLGARIGRVVALVTVDRRPRGPPVGQLVAGGRACRPPQHGARLAAPSPQKSLPLTLRERPARPRRPTGTGRRSIRPAAPVAKRVPSARH